VVDFRNKKEPTIKRISLFRHKVFKTGLDKDICAYYACASLGISLVAVFIQALDKKRKGVKQVNANLLC